MKFKGTPNKLVRITKIPTRFKRLPNHFRFDANGIFETEHPYMIKRLKQKFEIVEEMKEVILEKQETLEEEIDEEAIRKLAKESKIKSWHVKSIDRLLKELEEMEVL